MKRLHFGWLNICAELSRNLLLYFELLRPRIIPVLLLSEGGLVKSIRFRDYCYIGDPINDVWIFNDLKTDELVFLDIEATRKKRLISPELVTAFSVVFSLLLIDDAY